MSDRARANVALWASTIAFTVCFAVWMMNGVLVTYLVDNRVAGFELTKTQLASLIAIPVLTGSLMRLPASILTDRYGGRPVFAALMVLAAVPTWFVSTAKGYEDFWWLSLGFGLAGASFAVGIAFTSIWFPKEKQGIALGVFGAGNAGSALTSYFAPKILERLTDAGVNLDRWRDLPKFYAAALVVTAVAFFLLTTNKKAPQAATKTRAQRLAPLRHVRVWRFGLEYFLVFGGFVALSQWLVPYYVGAYGMSVATAGAVAAWFSWPSGVIRALGGWLSDRFGGRAVLYWTLGACAVACLLLTVPRMDVHSPGEAVIAYAAGKVEAVAPDKIVVSGREYKVRGQAEDSVAGARDSEALIFPTIESRQEPVVKVGDAVKRRQVLARGSTHVYFQANEWVFSFFVFLLGIAMGIGKAAVYRNIPDDFPDDVAVVGGIVGVIGGLGGWACPLFFGWMLGGWGIWTTCWIFFLALSIACLLWLRLSERRSPQESAGQVEPRTEVAPGARAAVAGGRR